MGSVISRRQKNRGIMDGGLGRRIEGYRQDAVDFGARVEDAAPQLEEAVLPGDPHGGQWIFLLQLSCQAAQTVKRFPYLRRLDRRFPR